MNVRNIVIGSVCALFLMTESAWATTPDSEVIGQFSKQQKGNIEKIVHDYLVEHPEVLIEASRVLQVRQHKQMLASASENILKNAPQLFDSKNSVVGNPKGQVTIVEFFDYQCGHCKNMSPVISALIQKNKDLRVVLKQFPIFGESSEYAAKAVLASQKQGKFQVFHEALMKTEEKLSQKEVLAIAKSQGLNLVKLEQDLKDPAVIKELDDNMKLAKALHLSGTPAFVVGSTPAGLFKAGKPNILLPGEVSEAELQKLIEQLKS